MTIDWFGRLLFAIAAFVSAFAWFFAAESGRTKRAAFGFAVLTAAFLLIAALGRLPW